MLTLLVLPSVLAVDMRGVLVPVLQGVSMDPSIDPVELGVACSRLISISRSLELSFESWLVSPLALRRWGLDCMTWENSLGEDGKNWDGSLPPGGDMAMSRGEDPVLA